jgi:hypothetical protein
MRNTTNTACLDILAIRTELPNSKRFVQESRKLGITNHRSTKGSHKRIPAFQAHFQTGKCRDRAAEGVAD